MEEEFLNSLYFKSIILGYDKYELIEMLDNNNDNPLETFLVLFTDTAKVDPCFFALSDEIIDKIQHIINKYRFDENNKEYRDSINNIIVFCNRIKILSEDEKDKIYLDYIKRQSVERHKIVFYINDLFDALEMDAIVYESIKNGDDINNPYIVNNIVSTAYYLLHNCFPLVLDDDFYHNLMNILKDEKILSKKDKKNAKKLIRTMNKIDNII